MFTITPSLSATRLGSVSEPKTKWTHCIVQHGKSLSLHPIILCHAWCENAAIVALFYCALLLLCEAAA